MLILLQIYQIKDLTSFILEYNILYHNGQAYYIDVSQSVESNHPNALNFLRMDCTNITNFFKKNKLPVMTMRELFEFITSPTIDNPIRYLELMSEKVGGRANETLEIEDKEFEEMIRNKKHEKTKKGKGENIDDETFQKVFIPQNLHQVVDAEKDIEKLNTVWLMFIRILFKTETLIAAAKIYPA